MYDLQRNPGRNPKVAKDRGEVMISRHNMVQLDDAVSHDVGGCYIQGIYMQLPSFTAIFSEFIRVVVCYSYIVVVCPY